MSDHSTHDDAHDEHDGDAQGGYNTHGPSLGPTDWKMWGVGVLGSIVALVVVAGFVVATGFAFNA